MLVFGGVAPKNNCKTHTAKHRPGAWICEALGPSDVLQDTCHALRFGAAEGWNMDVCSDFFNDNQL